MKDIETKTLDELREYAKELSTEWQKVVASLVVSVDFRCRAARQETPFQLLLDHVKKGGTWYSKEPPYQIKTENQNAFFEFFDWFYKEATNFQDISHWKQLAEIHSGSLHTLKAKSDMAQVILTFLKEEEKRIENEIHSLTKSLANIDSAHGWIEDICGIDYA